MYLVKRWNEIMGPKDERLEAEEGKSIRVGAGILLFGTIASLYYAISLAQVASATDHPLLTALGESTVPVQIPLILTILAAGVAMMALQLRQGCISSHVRFAKIDHIPWGFVALFAFFSGALVGLLTLLMRIVAEIQIVGPENIAWAGDLATGTVFFTMGFAIGFVAIALVLHNAIRRRHIIERTLEDENEL